MYLLGQLYVICFLADHTATAQANYKDNLFFKSTTQKADARLLLKVLVFGQQYNL